MEQKQLDELDDSFFGEEFIEDDSEEAFGLETTPTKTVRSEAAEEPELRLKKAMKKNAPAKKSLVKKSEKVSKKEVPVMESKKEALKEVTIERLETMKKGESTLSDANEKRTQTAKEKKITPEKEVKKEKETVEIKLAREKEAKTAVKTTVETSAPVNPWADEDGGSGVFKQASTWKALTGLTLVLLVLSIFTQGFDFSDKNALTGAAALSQQDAEEKALAYVNTQLLQPPFQASVESAEELETLYKVTLSVAGQTVDSYVTKDGKLFFPQGFNMDVAPKNSEENAELAEPSAPTVDVSADDDPVLGDANAPVTLVEFSDFQCPFCKKANDEALKEVKEKYVNTGKVKLVYRDFPLEFHPEAEVAALAAECADEQGQFWEYHDLLFANQASLSDANYKKWAEELGLDTKQFNECYKGLKYLDEVKKDLSDGQKYGVTGTPAFFVNGKVLTGAQPYTAFEQEIEAALAAVGATPTPSEQPEETKLGQEPAPEAVEKPAADPEPVGEVVKVTLNAKKWLFQPSEVKVKKGSTVALTVVPSDLEFTFAVPALGVEQQVSGATEVTFTASETGKFDFTCSSCEEWRGMKGTLAVE